MDLVILFCEDKNYLGHEFGAFGCGLKREHIKVDVSSIQPGSVVFGIVLGLNPIL